MGIVGTSVAVQILQTLTADGRTGLAQDTPAVYAGEKSKLEVLFGPAVFDEIRDKVVLDFGCGPGREAVELAKHGARLVIGLDIRPKWLDLARARAREHGVEDRCMFMETWTEGDSVDVVLSLDSFEHFADPGAILTMMRKPLKRDGCVLASFGPTWYHPLGGHLFSVFPWAHLLFTERSLTRWRSTLPGKKPTASFAECGLNQMTVRRFEKLVAESPFRFERFEAVPIRALRWAANRLSREFTTSIVRCKLVPAEAGRERLS